MLRFFRINDPYRLLGVLLILIIVSLPFFIQPADQTIQELKSIVVGESLHAGKSLYIRLIDDMAPFSAWFSNATYVLFGHSILGRHILSFLIIFFQSAFFSKALVQHKVYNENTYLPALIFGLLAFYSFDLLSLSPELLASTLLVFALNNLFKEIEFKVQQDEIILNMGIYIGLASLFIFSYSAFLFGALLILILFTRITFRRAALLIFGFLLPHALIASFYFFWNHQGNLVQYFYEPNFTWQSLRLVSLKSVFLLGLIPIVYLLLSLFRLNREAHFTKYQSQLLQVMFLWILIGSVQLVFTREFTPHSLFPLIPPLTYFISHYLLLIRRKRIAEMMLWLFVLGLVITSWTARNGLISAVKYNALYLAGSPYESIVKGKRILILENDLAIYKQNKMASYFFNWPLSRNIFVNSDYVENVTLIDQSFQQDPPDVIIDKDNLMKPVLERIPRLKLLYKRDGSFYYKISN
jgi:hypothetical protein